LEVFDADQTVVLESEVDSIKVKLSQMQLCRPRSFGNCWLACQLWQELGLDEFWQERIDDSRSDIPWSKVLKLLVVNRLTDSASEFYVHRQWFDKTAMDELLSTDYWIASKDRRAKERAMRKYRLRKYLAGLAKLRKNCCDCDKLFERLGALKQQAERPDVLT